MRSYRPLLVVALDFLAMVMLGSLYIYGVFLSPLEADYGWSRGALSIAYSIFMAVYASMQIVSGMLYDLRGPKTTLSLGIAAGVGYVLCGVVEHLWQLYLFYGIIAAVGMGALYVPCTSTAMKWFPSRKGLATGFVVAGLGIGMLILAPLAKYLIITHGWRLAFMYLGVLFTAVISLAALLVDDPERAPVKAESRRSMIARDVLKSRLFWLIYASFTLGSLAGAMVIIHVVPYAEDIGIPALAAAFTVSLIGISNVAGRMGMGAVLDKIGVRATLLLCFILQALCTWALLRVNDVSSLYAVAVVFGLAYGWIALYAPTVAELFGMEKVGSTLGALGTSFGVGAIVGPAMAGMVFDVTKSYLIAFTAGALMSLLSAVLAALARPRSSRLDVGS